MTPSAAQIYDWRNNVTQYAFDNFGFVPDAWQKQAFDVFPSMDPDKLRISLQACAGPGKTGVLAILGWNFLSCYGDNHDHPKGVGVSVTADNLKDNLWPEFSKWLNISRARHAYLSSAFTWQKERIFANNHPETWFLSARSWSKSADPEEQGRTLSGIHSEYVLFLIDESGEIPLSVLKSAEQAIGKGRFAKIVQAGNPTSHAGMLYAAATRLRDMWHIIRITGDPEDPDRSPRIDIEWAKSQIKLYTRTDPWVMAYILGQFPPSSLNSLIGIEEVEAAMKRHYSVDKYERSQKRIGVDVARFGDDENCLFPRQGLAAFKPVITRGQRTHDIAARVMLGKSKWGSEMEFVDGTGGYGAGVIDSMIQAGHSPQEIHFSGSPFDARYLNKRAEMWFQMVNWIKRGGALPPDPVLAKELSTPTYTFQNGKFQLESKEQIKKRLGFSPNRADALGLTFALPEMPSSTIRGIQIPHLNTMQNDDSQATNSVHEWDPIISS